MKAIKTMRIKAAALALAMLGLLGSTAAKAEEIGVTLLTDEGVERPLAIGTAERNLSVVLSEINRAQDAKTILATKGLPMDDFSLKSLLRIWAVTPFYCDDSEVVERVWVFKDGSMMVSHIPLIITPEGEELPEQELTPEEIRDTQSAVERWRDYILEAIREHLDDLEDVYLAEATLERVRRGEERVYTSEEMEALLEKMGN